MKTNYDPSNKRSFHNRPSDEEFIIDGGKARLYYAEKDNEEVAGITKMIEKMPDSVNRQADSLPPVVTE